MSRDSISNLFKLFQGVVQLPASMVALVWDSISKGGAVMVAIL
jgi:hypothetical protein